MTDRLKDKVALVIGASRGIGKAIALRFREEGASVVVSDFETKEGRATAEELGGDFIQTDISKLDDAIAAVSHTLECHGRLDIMVQNAGIYPWQLIETPVLTTGTV